MFHHNKDDAGVYTNLGWEVEVAGDVDGDGVNDLALVSRKVSGQKWCSSYLQRRTDVFPPMLVLQHNWVMRMTITQVQLMPPKALIEPLQWAI